jgi:hypothetical protein
MPQHVPVKRATQWDDKYYTVIYDLAKSGMPDKQIGRMLNVDRTAFNRWKRLKPALREALEKARGTKDDPDTFLGYVHGHLSPAVRPLWQSIMEIWGPKDSRKKGAPDKCAAIEALLRHKSKKVRQHLFLHALVAHNFNVSEACRRLALSMQVVTKWAREDPEFADLIAEIDVHKKNYFEGALMKLVRAGDPKAIIFVNKTYNKDRGYGNTVKIDHGGIVQHQHTGVPLDQLNLSPEATRELLEAVRAAKRAAPRLTTAEVVNTGGST